MWPKITEKVSLSKGKIGKIEIDWNDGFNRHWPAKTQIRVDSFQPMAQEASCHSGSCSPGGGCWVHCAFWVWALFLGWIHSLSSLSSLDDSLDSLFSSSMRKSSSSSLTMASKSASSSTGATLVLVFHCRFWLSRCWQVLSCECNHCCSGHLPPGCTLATPPIACACDCTA